MFRRKKTSPPRPPRIPPTPRNPVPPGTARPLQSPAAPAGASWHLPSGTTARATAGGSGSVLAWDSLGPDAVVGQVFNFRARTEQKTPVISAQGAPISVTVWNFNVVRYDRGGNQVHPVMPVEMRGQRLSGIVTDGDWVSVPGEWQKGRVREVKRVRNLTTDIDVGKGGRFSW